MHTTAAMSILALIPIFFSFLPCLRAQEFIVRNFADKHIKRYRKNRTVQTEQQNIFNVKQGKVFIATPYICEQKVISENNEHDRKRKHKNICD